jgi:hypothetical protein
MTKELLAALVASAREGLRDDWEWKEEVVTEAIVQLADLNTELVRAFRERMGGYKTIDEAVAADIRHEDLIMRAESGHG